MKCMHVENVWHHCVRDGKMSKLLSNKKTGKNPKQSPESLGAFWSTEETKRYIDTVPVRVMQRNVSYSQEMRAGPKGISSIVRMIQRGKQTKAAVALFNPQTKNRTRTYKEQWLDSKIKKLRYMIHLVRGFERPWSCEKKHQCGIGKITIIMRKMMRCRILFTNTNPFFQTHCLLFSWSEVARLMAPATFTMSESLNRVKTDYEYPVKGRPNASTLQTWQMEGPPGSTQRLPRSHIMCFRKKHIINKIWRSGNSYFFISCF